MSALEPLVTHLDQSTGISVPLPDELAALYGALRLPATRSTTTSLVVANFVSTLDGVVSLNEPGMSGGAEISGHNRHDRLVMGILRATADAVVVGAGTLRAVPRHLWTAEYVYPPFAPAYKKLRKDWGRSTPPLNVIVTASGNLELDRPVFQSASVPTLIVTTDPGYTRLTRQAIPTSTQAISVGDTKSISAHSILEAIRDAARSDVILVEGGPRLFGDFLAEQVLDELFLTLAPQIAGRDDLVQRPGLVSGKRFAPEHPIWSRLVSLKRSESHLFLRYSCRQPVL